MFFTGGYVVLQESKNKKFQMVIRSTRIKLKVIIAREKEGEKAKERRIKAEERDGFPHYFKDFSCELRVPYATQNEEVGIRGNIFKMKCEPKMVRI